MLQLGLQVSEEDEEKMTLLLFINKNRKSRWKCIKHGRRTQYLLVKLGAITAGQQNIILIALLIQIYITIVSIIVLKKISDYSSSFFRFVVNSLGLGRPHALRIANFETWIKRQYTWESRNFTQSYSIARLFGLIGHLLAMKSWSA